MIRKVHIDIFTQFAVNSQVIRKRFAKSLIRIHVIRKQFADRSQLIRKIAKAGSHNSHLSSQVIRKFTAMGSHSFLKLCGRCTRRVLSPGSTIDSCLLTCHRQCSTVLDIFTPMSLTPPDNVLDNALTLSSTCPRQPSTAIDS